MKPLHAITTLAAGLILLAGAQAEPKKHVNVDGNRTRAVHNIPLYDEWSQTIRPDDAPLVAPMSSRNTCGDCHDYDRIGMGWHFNSSLDVAKPGRPGEPWVLIDENTGTQIPISYRQWPGTWRPADLGMTAWDFVKTFGRHMPGGDAGEKPEDVPDPHARWDVSGPLEINCLACHNASHKQNQSEWVIQIGRENFRWAATGAGGLGIVENVASRVKDSWDFFDGPNLDNTWAAPPDVVYEEGLFDKKERVFFDVTRRPEPNRCYFCHSTAPAGFGADTRWKADGDVHVARGLSCADCHRNGLDHFIVRGYEGESDNPDVASLSCRGCHMSDPCKNAPGGRMTAPRPAHRGLPAIHLEKIACTACHSGYDATDGAGLVRTARANRLGVHGRAMWDTDLPYIESPVFVRQENGVIAPMDAIWPAFWARVDGGKVTPIPLEEVTPIVTALREAERLAKAPKPAEPAPETAAPETPAETPAAAPAETGTPEAEPETAAEAPAASPEAATPEPAAETPAAPEAAAPQEPAAEPAQGSSEVEAAAEEEAAVANQNIEPLTESQIAAVLTQLAKSGAGAPAYIGGGKLWKASSDGKSLTSSDSAAAKPYFWPVAHDVRPASESLGSGGCTDCHASDSGFFHGKVAAACPAKLPKPVAATMLDWQDLSPTLLKGLEIVAASQRIGLIVGVALLCALGAALAHFGFGGLESLFRLFSAANTKSSER